MSKEVAILRVRGTANIKEPVERTLRSLRLNKPNHMVIVKEDEIIKGMISRSKDYITWGEASKELKELVKDKYDEKLKVYRLNPPKKGYSRKGIKLHFKVGGALGNRGKDIIELIKRMI